MPKLERRLSSQFMTALQTGFLMLARDLVRADSTLCLEIRADAINIYYRGGSLLKISRSAGERYDLWFDPKYFGSRDRSLLDELPRVVRAGSEYGADGARDGIRSWLDAVPHLKHAMDLHLGKHRKDEREFQQLVVRENNFGRAAMSTDYFICDIEDPKEDGRFDMIAVQWLSRPAARKKNTDLGLAFIEMKYLDGALTGPSGLVSHVEHVDRFLSKPANLHELKSEMKCVFNQKRELGLIQSEKPMKCFSDAAPEYILILANHDPDKTALRREIDRLPACPHMDVKIAISSLAGYGLYTQNIVGLDDFRARFGASICDMSR